MTTARLTKAWSSFQEQIKAHFLAIGAEAKANVVVPGARTTHAVDVFVKTKFLGQELTWIIEAKLWKTRITKLHVLGLRTIVNDVGADRGFIISESGFQKGAHEAAKASNVHLRTFSELKNETTELIESVILEMYRKRTRLLSARYWAHSKRVRQDYDLRGSLESPYNFSGIVLLMSVKDAIDAAEKREYPVEFLSAKMPKSAGAPTASNFQQLINWLNLNLNLLDEELLLAESKMQEAGDFHPDLRKIDEVLRQKSAAMGVMI